MECSDPYVFCFGFFFFICCCGLFWICFEKTGFFFFKTRANLTKVEEKKKKYKHQSLQQSMGRRENCKTFCDSLCTTVHHACAAPSCRRSGRAPRKRAYWHFGCESQQWHSSMQSKYSPLLLRPTGHQV